MGWRLATTDAEDGWAFANGTALSPVADASAQNETELDGLMLDTRRETIAFVGHILDDDRGGELRQTNGYRVQDMRSGASTTRPAGAIDPVDSSTTLHLQIGRSAVFASTKISTVYSFGQVVSSVVGLTVGILGGFKAAFAAFERVFGSQLVWLCGMSGRVVTEEEAMARKTELDLLERAG